MESRFAHLRQRDTSVSMLRVKMSRRRSQSQKENRERAVNTRRQLEKLPELEVSSLDASIAMANMSCIQDKTLNHTKVAKLEAVEERLKQLERWKERKALEKEKERREKERKGVFKTGIYHPKNNRIVASLPSATAASTRAKETKMNTAPSQSSRITRSMKQQQQQQVQKPLKVQNSNTVAKKAQPVLEQSTKSRAAPVKPAPAPAKTKNKVCPVEPAARSLPTRSAARSAAPAQKDKPRDNTAGVRTTRSKALVNPVAPPSNKEKNCEETEENNVQPAVFKEPEPKKQPENVACPPSPAPRSEAEDSIQTDSVPAGDPAEGPSFAPEGFIFKAPSGLPSFNFEPLTPRSADAFLTPSPSFTLPPPAPAFNIDHQDEPSEPSPPKSSRRSPPPTSPTVAPPTQTIPEEPKHDVPYFRSEIANETDRLTSLCGHWEPKVEDESIPEEMRDRMRTAVGQARLLMKERFNQFSGLVDDCEFGRGEKITTCTDLQGFWDMVYYQVEDVNKKFDALKDAESRGWVEEHKPAPRQKKVVKKPVAAPSKPTGARSAARSRLAAAKAAMKAKQQAAEKAAKEDGDDDDDDSCSNTQEPQPQEVPQPADSVVFDGGFFQVESPLKPPGSLRRSSRLSAAVLPPASPSTSYLSPRRVTRQSLALAQTPVQSAASSSQLIRTPADRLLTPNKIHGKAPKSRHGTPQSSHSRMDPANTSLCCSPVKEALSDDVEPKGSSERQSHVVPELGTPTQLHLLPSISVTGEQNTQAKDVSPCKTPAPVSQVPEPSSCLSFTLSPCVTPSQASSPSPLAAQATVETQGSACHTPNSSVVEEIPGLDFERYLQPSLRCSLSPRETVSMETHSPMAVDVEMESPRGQSEDLLTRQEAALPAVSLVSALPSPQTQRADAALLLFTPDPKDRIRQSVCPTDLMVFTPPL